MMWFTADLHLGDTNILHDMDRPFDSVEEMNRKVIDAINECVAVDDRSISWETLPIVCPRRRRCACASASNARM